MNAEEPFLFYRGIAGQPGDEAVLTLPPGLTFEIWRPRWNQFRPAGLAGKRWLIWWLMDRLRLFSNRSYAIVLAREPSGAVVHRAVAFPGFVRFPFMSRADVQVGDIHTVPSWRRRGLAAWSLATIAATGVPPGGCVWYLTRRSNESSRRLAEHAGFHLVGEGRRRRRLGLGVLAVFELDVVSRQEPSPPF